VGLKILCWILQLFLQHLGPRVQNHLLLICSRREKYLILYEVAVLQAGASVLINDSIGHGNMIRGLYWSNRNTLVICECNGPENAWGKKLGLIGRVLACPSSSVVPGEGWRFQMFFFKSVKEVHTCNALMHIWCILCGWVRREGNETCDWRCIQREDTSMGVILGATLGVGACLGLTL
jgi:hypothetical protein